MPTRSALLACSPLLLALVAAVSLPATGAAGTPTATASVHFLPGATADQVAAGQPSRALLTWELDGGVLVVDRRAAGEPDWQATAATELRPRVAGGEFFLVGGGRGHRHGQPDAHRRGGHADLADLARFGHVHLEADGAAVVEVEPERLDAFLQAGLCLQYLDRSPLLPAGEGTGRSAPLPLARSVDPAAKADYLDALEQDAFDQVIREISGDLAFWHDGQPHVVATRYYSTAGNDLVTDYLAQQLASWGYAVELDTFSAWGQICRNVVATLPGSTLPDEYVVVGGHFDSTSGDAQHLAPGAEDNASGTSLVMEVARASAGRQFERSVQFVLFDAEEIGLRGSQHFVDEAVTEGREIIAAITADMVAYHDRNYGVIIEGQTPWEWLMTAMADNVAAHTDIMSEKTYHSWGSDHVPFQQAGIAAFLAIDMDWDEYPYYHSTSDSWDKIAATSGLGLQIARAAAGTLADTAGLLSGATAAPGAPPAPALALSAYPNPFNPRVTLAFAVSAPVAGELAIHDVAGRKVATVASGVFLAGEQTVTWNGLDDRGQAAPSGVYLVRLETADGAAVSRKVQLVR